MKANVGGLDKWARIVVGVLLIVTFVPQLSTWLPSLLLGGK